MTTPSHLRSCALSLSCAALFAALATAQTIEARDKVVLNGGRELEGTVVRISADEIVLRVGSTDRKIDRKDVMTFTSVAVQHRELVNAWIDTPADDADALLALAKRADEVGLPHEARLFRWYALLVRPSDAAIHEALGNREQRGKWLQWPPQPGPGSKRMKPKGFEEAASSTSRTSIDIRSKIIFSSLTRAMLTARKMFSVSFAASAARVDETRTVDGTTRS
jgi:hypothetical protein